MQEQRDREKAGTGAIRVEELTATKPVKVNEAQAQAEYKAILDSINLGAETFTHPNPAYQIMAE